MQTKLIIFDLDGVLVDAKHIHFHALNKALESFDPNYPITWNEHLAKYDGLKTYQKLEMLTEHKGVPKELYNLIWNKKQEYTANELNSLTENLKLRACLTELKDKFSCKIAVCSNSIKATITTVLTKMNVIDLFDCIISNEDVVQSKPYPEMYWKAMIQFGVLPEETVIVEDSPPGLLAAYRSNANVVRVNNANDLTFEKVSHKCNTHYMTAKWTDDKLNVLIPMAGAGSRFEQAGYVFPKPLIEVHNKPMIQVVVENLNLDANYIFIVQKSHREKYNLDSVLSLIAPNCKIVETDGLTEGAACTALLAKSFIDNDQPLIIANSDQFIEWNSIDFMYKMSEQNADGGIVTFNSTHPKWSFVKINESSNVIEVAEKNPISDIATTGIYFWKKGNDFVRYAEQMIDRNIRVNNEFYICPVFNEAIKDNKIIKTFNIDRMWGLGTPDDLNYYLNEYKNN
jgi:HAD superfamily hydrolase (TIGR01509 family)